MYLSIPEYTLGRLFTRKNGIIYCLYLYSINKEGMFGVFLYVYKKMYILGAMVEQKNENGTKIFPFDR